MKTTAAIFVLLLAISLLMGCNDSRQPTAPRTDDKAKAVLDKAAADLEAQADALDKAGDSAKVADLDAKAAVLDKASTDLEAQADALDKTGDSAKAAVLDKAAADLDAKAAALDAKIVALNAQASVLHVRTDAEPAYEQQVSRTQQQLASVPLPASLEKIDGDRRIPVKLVFEDCGD
jgi:hypothetical protein